MSSQQLEARIPADKLGQRLDAVLAELFSDYSRSRIQNWIKAGKVALDGQSQSKPNMKVLGGEKVVLQAEIEEEIEYQAQDIPLDIVYEDADILVINKPAGLVVHPGPGIRTEPC